MSEHREFSPTEREVAAHLLAIAQKGDVKADDESHGALHGTSLEILELLLQSGGLIERSTDGGDESSEDGLSVFPTPGLMLPTMENGSPWALEMLFDPEEAEEMAKAYASGEAEAHFIVTTLGISLNDRDGVKAASRLAFNRGTMGSLTASMGLPMGAIPHLDMEEIDDMSYFSGRGVNFEKIEAAITGAQEREGFLLGISPRMLTEGGVQVPKIDLNTPDVRIKTSIKGLPFRFISGIQPLGPVEKKFIEDLRKRV